MIGRFLPRLRMSRPTGRQPSSKRSPDRFQRRLAVEPIEDRLLLSAAGTDTVSDGGTVVLDSSFSESLAYRPLTFIIAGSDGNTSRVVNWTGRTDVDLSGEYTTRSDGLGNGRYRAQGEVQGSPGTLHGADLDATTGIEKQAAPTAKPVAPEDLVPTPPDDGMVDLTYAAYDRVFAEMGSSDDAVAANSSYGKQFAYKADRDRVPTLAKNNHAETSHQDLRTLIGSRGRLAAFDLAIERESKSDFRARFEETGLETPVGRKDVPTPTSAIPDRLPITPAAFSRVEPEVGTRSDQPHISLVHHLVLSEQPGLVIGSATSARAAAHQELAVSDHQTDGSAKPLADDRLQGRVAYLDQRREKPVAQLAIALGLGYVILGQRYEASDDSEHEQLPPKKRFGG